MDDLSWSTHFPQFLDYVRITKSGLVPIRYPANPSLAMWAARIRSNLALLTLNQLRELVEHRFDFIRPHVNQWVHFYLQFAELMQKPSRPQISVEFESINDWCDRQRQRRRQGKLPSDRIKLLDRVGFDWHPNERKASAWDKYYEKLRAYYVEHGLSNAALTQGWKCPVLPSSSAFLSLRYWCNNQRQRRKDGVVAPDRIKLLDQIGFDWHPSERVVSEWLRHFNELCDFYKKKGPSKIPITPEYRELQAWAQKQRNLRNENRLSSERFKALDAIGFIWEPFDGLWDQRIADLRKFIREHGHADVPIRYPKNRTLGTWIIRIRNLFQHGCLSPQRIQQLEKLGFAWNSRLRLWRIKFEQLKDYATKHGTTHVPVAYGDWRLTGWTHSQRHRRHLGRISEEEIRELDSIGFDWKGSDRWK